MKKLITSKSIQFNSNDGLHDNNWSKQNYHSMGEKSINTKDRSDSLCSGLFCNDNRSNEV